MNLCFYYDEMNLPITMRIQAPALCLDHTFSPNASFGETFGYKDLISLLSNPLFRISAEFSSGSLYIDMGDEIRDVEGWVLLSQEGVIIKPISELPCSNNIK